MTKTPRESTSEFRYRSRQRWQRVCRHSCHEREGEAKHRVLKYDAETKNISDVGNPLEGASGGLFNFDLAFPRLAFLTCFIGMHRYSQPWFHWIKIHKTGLPPTCWRQTRQPIFPSISHPREKRISSTTSPIIL